MFPKSSLPFAPVSGFVALEGGGAMPPSIAYPRAKRSPLVVHRPVAEPVVVARETMPAPVAPAPEAAPAPVVVDGVESGLRHTIGWQSRHGLRARRVEGVLLVAIVGYFVVATLSGLHLF